MQLEVAAALPEEILLFDALCVICSCLGLSMICFSSFDRAKHAFLQGLAVKH